MRPAFTAPPASYVLYSIGAGGRGLYREYCRMLGETESAARRDPGWGADVSARGVVSLQLARLIQWSDRQKGVGSWEPTPRLLLGT